MSLLDLFRRKRRPAAPQQARCSSGRGAAPISYAEPRRPVRRKRRKA